MIFAIIQIWTPYWKITIEQVQWESRLTLDEIWQQYGVTRERIRQILSKASKLAEGGLSLGGKGFSDIFTEKIHSAKCKEMENRADEKRLNRFSRKFKRLIS